MERTAGFEKRAFVKEELSRKVGDTLVLNEMGKIKGELSKEAKLGLTLARKKAGCETFTMFMKVLERAPSTSESKDPIRKLLAEKALKASSPAEAQELIGSFSYAYEKKNIKRMAELVEVDEQVLTLVLLWYTRNTSQGKTANSRGYKSRLKTSKKVIARVIGVTETVLTSVDKITGGTSDWIVGFLPDNLANLLRKPLKWAFITAIVLGSWAGIGQLALMSKTFFITSMVALKAKVGALAFKGIAVNLIVPFAMYALGWFGFQLRAYYRWSKKNLADGLKLPFVVVLTLLRHILQGSYKVATWLKDELVDFVKDNKSALMA